MDNAFLDAYVRQRFGGRQPQPRPPAQGAPPGSAPMQPSQAPPPPRAAQMAMEAGAPIIGGKFNVTDFGKNDPSWYDIPEPQRRAKMQAAMAQREKEAQQQVIAGV